MVDHTTYLYVIGHLFINWNRRGHSQVTNVIKKSIENEIFSFYLWRYQDFQ